MDTQDTTIDWDAVEDQYDGDAIDLKYAYVFEERDDGMVLFIVVS
jgi:hypothetical protein